MNTNMLAMAVAFLAVMGLIVTLGGLNLLVGAYNSLFGRPQFKILKSQYGKNGLAFYFQWDEVKWPIAIDILKIRLFNPFGQPSQIEIFKNFPLQNLSFCQDIEFGPKLQNMINAPGFNGAILQIEVSSQKDGMSFQFDMKGVEFLKKIEQATQTVEEVQKVIDENKGREEKNPIVYGVVPKDTVAETVPGKGAILKLATNPICAGQLAAHAPAGGGATAAGGEVAKAENFAVDKVWIAPGCIVCNACEDIFPEVFDVQADTCYIRPNAPLNDGLRIQEASDACPVEVIKYTKSQAAAS